MEKLGQVKSHEIPHLMIDVLASGEDYTDQRRFPKMFWYPKTVGFNAKKKVSWLGLFFLGTPETIGNPHILVELAIFIFDETDLSDLLIVRVATSMASIWIILVMWLLISSRAHPQQSHLISDPQYWKGWMIMLIQNSKWHKGPYLSWPCQKTNVDLASRC